MEELEKTTCGQRWADRIAKFGGSWTLKCESFDEMQIKIDELSKK